MTSPFDPTAPIIVTDTDDLQRRFQAAIFDSVLGVNLAFSDRLALKLVEVLRANCPTPPDLIDAQQGPWSWVACYSDEEGNLRSRADLDSDPELSPVTEVEN